MRRVFSVALVLALCCFGAALRGYSQSTPRHRLEMRDVRGQSKFFDRQTGKEFVPRGYNYARLQKLKKHSDGNTIPYHSTFNRGLYDRARAEKALKAMAAGGYNTVRVFLNYTTEGGIGDPGKGLDRQYVANFVDFLRLAKQNSILVLPVIDWLPIPETKRGDRSVWCPDFQCTAAHILSEDGVKANRDFFIAFIRELKAAKAPFEALFGYAIRNELAFEMEIPPLSLTRGSLTAANGKTYALGDAAQKQAMLDEGLVYWANEVRTAIRGEDPTALVGVGLIPPQAPHKIRSGDARFSVTRPLIQKSSLDFVDVHVYPEADGFGMKEFAENFGFSKGTKKAVIMGEFGGLVTMYATVDAAARAMVDLQRSSAEYGVDGWLLWAWDMDIIKETWAAVDSGGTLSKALAPKTRAKATDGFTAAPGAPLLKVRASAAYQGMPAENAVDGTMSQWSAGAFPPQWIEVSVQPPSKLAAVRLVVGQSPGGPTTHELWLKARDGSYEKVETFDGETKDFDRLEHKVRGGGIIESIKVVTVKSPSWVGWREIELVRQSTE
jgi:hypothetical protein